MLGWHRVVFSEKKEVVIPCNPIPSMGLVYLALFSYIWVVLGGNVGKYSSHENEGALNEGAHLCKGNPTPKTFSVHG